MIDLRQLEALRAVATEGSVARAAKSLSWSHPTLDYHLHNLDRLIGEPTTVRGPRGTRLTAVGQLLLERGREILTLTDLALVDARELSQMGRVRLRVGMFPTAAAMLLPATVAKLASVDIKIDTVLNELGPLVAAVNNREVDAALVYSIPGHRLSLREDVHTVEVLRDPMLLALPVTHPLAGRASINRATLLSLHDEPWLLGAASDDPIDRVATDAFAAAGHHIKPAIRTDDFQVMLAMIAAGVVIGLVPQLAMGTHHTGVSFVPIDDPAFTRTILLATPRSSAATAPSAAMKHLVAALRHAILATG